MKLGPATKLEGEARQRQRKFDDCIMSTNCGFIVILLIYGQFGAFRKPDYGRMVCKTFH